jgi:hypothetical protein
MEQNALFVDEEVAIASTEGDCKETGSGGQFAATRASNDDLMIVKDT